MNHTASSPDPWARFDAARPISYFVMCLQSLSLRPSAGRDESRYIDRALSALEVSDACRTHAAMVRL